MTRHSREGIYGGDRFDDHHGLTICDDCGNELGSRSCAETHATDGNDDCSNPQHH